MDPILTTAEKLLLAAILNRGAADASTALSRWVNRPVRVAVGAVEQVELSVATEILGPSDALVAACPMELSGVVSGQLILVFEDRAGLATVDLVLQQPLGTTSTWGELEQSVARETANIVGCAYVNSLATHLPSLPQQVEAHVASLLPGPPGFRHEFAASLLEFALMDQAMRSDHLLVINTTFSLAETRLDWSLLLVPGGDSLAILQGMLQPPSEAH